MRLGENASRGWAVRAFACGGCAVIGLWAAGLLLGALFAPLRIFGQSSTCQSNVFHLARAFRMYADDYDDRLPQAAGWMDRSFFYINQERYLHCPTVGRPRSDRYGYAMNGALGGIDRAKIADPEAAVLVYDSTRLERSASEPSPTFPHPGRHRTRPRKGSPPRPGNMVGYASGSASIKLDRP